MWVNFRVAGTGVGILKKAEALVGLYPVTTGELLGLSPSRSAQ
jgi:hypothetical protein